MRWKTQIPQSVVDLNTRNKSISLERFFRLDKYLHLHSAYKHMHTNTHNIFNHKNYYLHPSFFFSRSSPPFPFLYSSLDPRKMLPPFFCLLHVYLVYNGASPICFLSFYDYIIITIMHVMER